MLKRLILITTMLACSFPVLADSWDSNKNIDKAMNAALKTYKSNGTTGMIEASKNCYAGLDTSYRNKNVGRDVEYCITYEISSKVIDEKVCEAMNFPLNEYFSTIDVAMRAMYHLETARIVRLPEEFNRYLVPRVTKIRQELPPKM